MEDLYHPEAHNACKMWAVWSVLESLGMIPHLVQAGLVEQSGVQWNLQGWDVLQVWSVNQ